MANAAQVAGTGKAEYSIWRVITASSVGTMIEWYDFYIFGSLAAILGPKFYPPGNDTFAMARFFSFCRWFAYNKRTMESEVWGIFGL